MKQQDLKLRTLGLLAVGMVWSGNAFAAPAKSKPRVAALPKPAAAVPAVARLREPLTGIYSTLPQGNFPGLKLYRGDFLVPLNRMVITKHAVFHKMDLGSGGMPMYAFIFAVFEKGKTHYFLTSGAPFGMGDKRNGCTELVYLGADVSIESFEERDGFVVAVCCEMEKRECIVGDGQHICCCPERKKKKDRIGRASVAISRIVGRDPVKNMGIARKIIVDPLRRYADRCDPFVWKITPAAFWQVYRQAIRDNDKMTVAKMYDFPLFFDGERICTRAEFIRLFDEIFSPTRKAAILRGTADRIEVDRDGTLLPDGSRLRRCAGEMEPAGPLEELPWEKPEPKSAPLPEPVVIPPRKNTAVDARYPGRSRKLLTEVYSASPDGRGFPGLKLYDGDFLVPLNRLQLSLNTIYPVKDMDDKFSESLYAGIFTVYEKGKVHAFLASFVPGESIANTLCTTVAYLGADVTVESFEEQKEEDGYNGIFAESYVKAVCRDRRGRRGRGFVRIVGMCGAELENFPSCNGIVSPIKLDPLEKYGEKHDPFVEKITPAALWQKYRQAFCDGDKMTVAKMYDFPEFFNGEKVYTRAEFIERFDEIFSPQRKRRILTAVPESDQWGCHWHYGTQMPDGSWLPGAVSDSAGPICNNQWIVVEWNEPRLIVRSWEWDDVNGKMKATVEPYTEFCRRQSERWNK